MKKKAVKKEVQKIKETNDQIIEFLEGLSERHEFSTEENEAIHNTAIHLKNMNLLFDKMGTM